MGWLNETIEDAKNKEYTMLEAGGHKCIIKKIDVVKTRNGDPQYLIYFDTTEDDRQPAYYLNVYVNDKAVDKVWRGRHWMNMYGTKCNDKGTPWWQVFFGKFCAALEASNEGFEVDRDDSKLFNENYLDQFKDKKIGMVFYKDHYSNASGEARASMKVKYFCDINKAENQPIPEETGITAKPATGQSGAEGFMQLADEIEEGLPFNV